MEEQMMVLKNISCFDPVHIFECGQCFRWNQQQDGSYIGIVRQNVIQVRKVNNTISITSMGKDPL